MALYHTSESRALSAVEAAAPLYSSSGQSFYVSYSSGLCGLSYLAFLDTVHVPHRAFSWMPNSTGIPQPWPVTSMATKLFSTESDSIW